MNRVARMTIVALVGVLVLGGVARAQGRADDEQDKQMAMRLERLERQVRQMAEQQQQFLQRAGGAMERRGQPPAGDWRPPEAGPRPGAPQLGGPRPGGARLDGPRPGMAPPGGPAGVTVNWPGPKAKSAFWCAVGVWRLMILILAIIHVTLAIWVFGDIRRHGEGHGIFIILALLAGIPAMILYALIRIGDRKITSN